MARIKKRKNLKPVLFIACEGTSSEYQYFKSWAESEYIKEIFENVSVYPDENEDKPKTTPYQLYEKAKKQVEEGSTDYAWIVFDKDNHPRLPETFLESAAANIKIAFSSRSFEEWVLLHFEKNNDAFNATECKDANDKPTNCGSIKVPYCAPAPCLTGHIRRRNYINNYSKKKTFDLFSAINARTEIALVNSAWLRYRGKASVNTIQPLLHALNPYTDVDQLILVLQNRADKIEWGPSGNNVVLDNWIINARLVKDSIVVRLSHTKPQAVALNALFPMPMFFTTDDILNDTPCVFVGMKYILNTHGSTLKVLCAGDIVEYTLKSNNQLYFLFKDQENPLRIYVHL